MIYLTIEENAGLGNQLFQFANGYALAKKYNQPIHLISYIGRSDNIRAYMLDQLSLDYSIIRKITRVDRANFFKGKNFKGSNFLNRLYRKQLQNKYAHLCECGMLEKRSMTKGQNRIYREPEELKNDGNYYLEGFYECYKYFIDCADDIRKQFKILDKVVDCETKGWENEIRGCNSVAMHIRMGDFATCNRIFPIEFYESAYHYINGIIENPVFYIFSEDDVVKTYFEEKKQKNIRIVTLNCENKDMMEWHLLSQCHYHVVTNSTYSWWSAFVADYPGKRVFIPQMDEYLKRENADIYRGSKLYGKEHYTEYFLPEYEVLPKY